MEIGRVFEAVNGSLLVFNVFILGVFVWYIVVQMLLAWEARIVTSPIIALRYLFKELEGALALLVYFVGATIARAAVWQWRYVLNEGDKVTGPIENVLLSVLMLGVLVSAVGAFCILRVFSVKSYRWYVQTGAGVCAAVIVILAVLH